MQDTAAPPPPPPARGGSMIFFTLSQKRQCLEFKRGKEATSYEQTKQIQGRLAGWWKEWDPGKPDPDPKRSIPARWDVSVMLEDALFDGAQVAKAVISFSAVSTVYSTGSQLLQANVGDYISLRSQEWDRGATLEVDKWDGQRWIHFFTPKKEDRSLDDRYEAVIKGMEVHPAAIAKPTWGRQSDDASAGAGEAAGSSAAGAEQSEGSTAPAAWGFQWRQWPELAAWQEPQTPRQEEMLAQYIAQRELRGIQQGTILATVADTLKLDPKQRGTKGHWRLTIELLRDCGKVHLDKFIRATEYDPYADE